MQTIQEFIEEAIENNVFYEVMGWDLKHGPTDEEWYAYALLKQTWENKN
jgi:hypothetical protein